VTGFLFAMRLGRWGVAGFSVLAFFSSLLQAVGFYQIAGHTAAERAAFGRSMSVLATQFSVILPPPVRLDTAGGYVQWRSFGSLAILFAVWALAAAAGAARGDEERGLVEAVLAASASRVNVVAARMAGFTASSFVAALAAGLGFVVGVRIAGDSFSLLAVVEAAIVLCALSVSCYALALLIAQVTPARMAVASAGIVVLGLFFVNSLSREYQSLSTWRWLSPFRYYELSQPLPPGGPFDLRATLIMFFAAAATGLAAAVAFAFRDLGSPLFAPPARSRPTSYDASPSPLWRIAVVRGLYDRRLGLVVWALGVSALGFLLVGLTKAVLEPLLSIRALYPYLSPLVHGDLYASFLGFTWLGVAELLFAAFAIASVARWSAEDADGRLELILATPRSRAAVVVERALVLAIGALFVAAFSGLAVAFASHAQGIDVDRARLAVATLLLVPFTLVFAAAGALLASWSPRAAVGLLGGVAFASYLLQQLGPIFKWPDWTQYLSVFKLYGEPLSGGIDRAGLEVMIAIVIAGFGASILAMQRRDVGA
jgi:ABC-2 type transport system permease protein